RLEETDREMEGAEVLPRAAVEVHSVVEGDGADRRRDPEAASEGEAHCGEIDGRGIDPEVAHVEEEPHREDVGERETKLEARVEREVAAADRDLVDGELAAEDPLGDVLGDELVGEEGSDRVDAAEEERAIRVGLALIVELEVVARTHAHGDGGALLGEAD